MHNVQRIVKDSQVLTVDCKILFSSAFHPFSYLRVGNKEFTISLQLLLPRFYQTVQSKYAELDCKGTWRFTWSVRPYGTERSAWPSINCPPSPCTTDISTICLWDTTWLTYSLLSQQLTNDYPFARRDASQGTGSEMLKNRRWPTEVSLSGINILSISNQWQVLCSLPGRCQLCNLANQSYNRDRLD